MRNERGAWRRIGVRLTGVMVLMAVSCGVVLKVAEAHGQQGSGTTARPPADTTTEPPAHTTADTPMKEQMQAAAVSERHKRLVADADKLLQLANELKVEVDKSTKNEMSVTAVKKAAEIEKLAHDVKERLKGE